MKNMQAQGHQGAENLLISLALLSEDPGTDPALRFNKPICFSTGGRSKLPPRSSLSLEVVPTDNLFFLFFVCFTCNLPCCWSSQFAAKSTTTTKHHWCPRWLIEYVAVHWCVLWWTLRSKLSLWRQRQGGPFFRYSHHHMFRYPWRWRWEARKRRSLHRYQPCRGGPTQPDH